MITKVFVVNSIDNTGNQISGPRTVKVQFINPLRFETRVGVKTELQNAPALPGALAPAVTAFTSGRLCSSRVVLQQVEARAAAAAAPAGIDFEPTFDSYRACYQLYVERAHQVDSLINKAIQTTNLATNSYTQVLNVYTNVVLKPGEPEALQTATDDQKVFSGYYDFQWPTADIDQISGSLSKFADDYQSMAQQKGYSEWIKNDANKQSFTYFQNGIAALQQHLSGLGQTSDAALKAQCCSGVRSTKWRLRFYRVAHLPPSGFAPVANVPCGQWFGKA